MPRYDKTGPWGYGPRTGRGLGPCGRGLGFRRGFARGYGFRYQQPYSAEPAPLSKEEEERMLEAELKEIQAEKEEIEKRLKGLK